MRQIFGKFNERLLKIVNDDLKYSPPDFLAKASENVWGGLLSNAKKKGGRVWNGEIYRLANINIGDNVTVITLGTIDFKTHYTTSFVVDKLKKIPFSRRPNGMYVSAYIKTIDNKYIFGIKSNESILTDNINFIGGNLNKDEMSINKVDDIFNFFEKEFDEELGIKKEFINRVSGLSIFQGENMRVGILLKCDLFLTSQEVRDKFCLNFENMSILFLDRNRMTPKRFPKNANPNITKTLHILKDHAY